MELKFVAFGAIIAVALLVCGCAGAAAVVIPALNNELPAAQAMKANVTVAATDPIVGTWKMADPVIKDGGLTIENNDSRWHFETDGSYRQTPLLIGLFRTTGVWTRAGTDRYEIVSGKDSRAEHYRLIDGQLCQEEDQRYVLIRA